MAGRAGAGDVLITVSIAPHNVFTLDGADVRLELPITLYEAALGAKVRVPTLDKPVEITIPAWTSSGRTFRLKGKGFPAKAGRGDLLATARIVLPDRSDPDLEALMKNGRPTSPTIRARICERPYRVSRPRPENDLLGDVLLAICNGSFDVRDDAGSDRVGAHAGKYRQRICAGWESAGFVLTTAFKALPQHRYACRRRPPDLLRSRTKYRR